MKQLGPGQSLAERLRDLDSARPSLPGEHWAAFGLGLYFLLHRRRTVGGRFASMVSGVALVARALSGRDGAVAMWRRQGEVGEMVDVAAPWPYDERVRIAKVASVDERAS